MPSCQCGCGGYTHRRYCPGHDAKHKSTLLAAARRGEQWAYDELFRLGWIHFLLETPAERGTRTVRNRGRKFGIELEIISSISRYAIASEITAVGLESHVEGYNHTTRRHWKITTDGSVSADYGKEAMEVVSPILRGDDGFEQIRKVSRVLNASEAEVNKTCGFHVHVDIKDLTVEQVKLLVCNYWNCQNNIDNLIQFDRRANRNQYCQSWSDYQLQQMNGCLNVKEIANLAQVDKYRTINLRAYPRQGTVEFRQHGGTIDANKIINWTRFCLAMVEAAKEGRIVYYWRDVAEGDVLRFLERREESLARRYDGRVA